MSNRPTQPTRRLPGRRVRAGDVVLVRHGTSLRWLLVEYATEHVIQPVWSGRWVFGDDAGTRVTHAARASRYYTAKSALDAREDARRLGGT